MITENELNTVINVISFNFNVVDCEWFYENQLCIIVTDNNNTTNYYRIFINTEFNRIIFQYINDNDGEIIDLNTYILDNSTFIDISDDITVLIISILNYYMNTLKYIYKSE